ncbi:MAG: glycoside hydrolase family 15 protein [Gemmatimonadota bacterium]
MAAATPLLTVTILTTAPAVSAAAISTGTAPGCCGLSSAWSPGNKTFLGRAEAPAATSDDTWFTGTSGILTEIFYPTLDTADFTDQQFIVGDAGHTWDETEKTDASHSVSLASGSALAWTVTNTGNNGSWKITKTVYTDPGSPAVIEHVTFTALRGTLGDYLLYQLSNPSQDGNGNNDAGQTATYNGRQMLVTTGENLAGNGSNASAIAVGNGLGWLTQSGIPMLSSGYVGTNDGWQDLLGGGSPDHTMNDAYDLASGGNIAQMGELDLSPVASQTSASFDLVIGLGPNAGSAESTADGELSGLAANPSGTRSSYLSQWQSWTAGLSTYGGIGGQQYLTAAMTLKASQDPSTGALVAGLGTPWGDAASASNLGYHRTWSRDAFNSATALMLAGDNADADSLAHFLFDRQQQSDGHFPQNSLVSGAPSWNGIQLDETAYPIILAWQLRSYDPALTGSSYYTSHIRPAANYLIQHGPSTPMERWEENSGYSPSTIAAEIAALYLAGQIASANGDSGSASTYTSTADSWASQVGNWTYATSGPYGNGQYFERISPDGNPNDGSPVTIANGGGTYNENQITDNGFLQLAILGILPASDLRIANSIAITANPAHSGAQGSLEEQLPDGIAFFRYNHDGYGETASGGDYTGAGIGRLWPILDGEYGQYRALLGDSVAPRVSDLRQFAAPSGMISEQIWDTSPPAGDTPGTPTMSMSALNWSMSMYIQLVAEESAQQSGGGGGPLPGMPAAVYQHYAAAAHPAVSTSPSPPAAGQQVTVRYDGFLAGGATSITMHWGHDGWQTITDTPMARQADGSWTATVTIPAGSTGLNTAYYNQSGTWDNNSSANYNIGAIG